MRSARIAAERLDLRPVKVPSDVAGVDGLDEVDGWS